MQKHDPDKTAKICNSGYNIIQDTVLGQKSKFSPMFLTTDNL